MRSYEVVLIINSSLEDQAIQGIVTRTSDHIKANGGSYNMKTVSGDTITAKMSGKKIMIFDESGGSATITTADVNQSNGEIHVINRVLLPK